MYTQCPQCATVFRLNAGQLAQARGQVRCGVCEHVFNALESLSESPERYVQIVGGVPPAAVEAPVATAVADIEPMAAATAGDRAAKEPAIPPPNAATTPDSGPSLYESLANFIVETNGAEPAPPPATSVTPEATPITPRADAEPDALPPIQPAHGLREMKPFTAADYGRATNAPWAPLDPLAEMARREPTVSLLDGDPLRDENADLAPISVEPRPTAVMPASENGGGWRIAAWALANIALIAVLLGQYAYFNRTELAQYPDLRPWLTSFCATLGCDVPLLRDPARISLANRVVQSHPAHEHALLIDATLVNEAAFTQAYPELELRFSDLDNRLVAGRRFRPAEYLPSGTDILKGMTPRQPVKFSLEIADPGKQAVSFQFNLL